MMLIISFSIVSRGNHAIFYNELAAHPAQEGLKCAPEPVEGGRSLSFELAGCEASL